VRFGANSKAREVFSICILWFLGSKKRSTFLEIETQKHSKCRKWEGGRLDVRCNFYEKRAFFIVFEGVFSLEWFGRKMCFVKYIYHINNSLMAKW
jgi:hypothetical protein